MRDLRRVDGGPGVDGPANLVVSPDGRIDCFGTADECPTPRDARAVEADGRWIVPGLIDTHVHLPDEADEVRTRRQQALRFLLGITTVRDAGTPGDRRVGPSLAERTWSENLAAPRVVRGRMLPAGASSRGGTDAGLDRVLHLTDIPALILGERAPPDSIAPGEWARTRWLEADPDALRSVARDLAERGVWLEPVLVAEASSAAPYRVPYSVRRLLELPWVLETLLEVPTGTPAPVAGVGGEARAREGLERMRGFVHEFHDAGGRVITGTNDRLAPGLALHEELRQLVEAGLTPVQALRAATELAAAALALDDRLGTLNSGKLADFVILEADPRLDIGHTLEIWRVAKGGRLYDPNVLYDELMREPGILSGTAARLIVAALGMAVALLTLAWAVHVSRNGSLPGARCVRWR